jgi:hypothetical protein
MYVILMKNTYCFLSYSCIAFYDDVPQSKKNNNINKHMELCLWIVRAKIRILRNK